MFTRLIYALIDPFSGELRYVGLSTRGLARAKEHWEPGRLERPHTHKQFWIRFLVKKRETPIIRVIQSWVSISDTDLAKAEMYWIKYFRAAGCPLTNLTGGGEGVWGGLMPEETRRKISSSMRGKRFSDQHRANISAVRKGKKIHPWSEERRARGVPHWSGQKHSVETRGKMSESARGRDDFESNLKKARRAACLVNKGSKHTKEHKDKISASLKGRVPWNKGKRLPEETKVKISVTLKKRKQGE